MIKNIKAQTVFNAFEGGFWGLTGDDNYLPLNYPEQLKTSGIWIECEVEILKNVETQFNWGVTCRIVSFHTLNPYA